MTRSEVVVSRQSGPLKVEIGEVRDLAHSRFLEFWESSSTSEINLWESRAAQGMGGPPGFVDEKSGTAIFKKGLLDSRDLKMPMFPVNPEDVGVYRRWYKAFTAHCERIEGFDKAGVVFRYLKSWPNPLHGNAEIFDW